MDNVDCKLISQKEPHTFEEMEKKKVHYSFLGGRYCSHSRVFVSLMGNVKCDYFIKNVNEGIAARSSVIDCKRTETRLRLILKICIDM